MVINNNNINNNNNNNKINTVSRQAIPLHLIVIIRNNGLFIASQTIKFGWREITAGTYKPY